MPLIRPLAPLAVAALATLGVAACGSSSSDSSSSSSAPATTSSAASTTPKTTSAASSGGGGKTVKVGESEFKITPPNGTASAGNVAIDVSNTGQIPHQLEVEGNGVEKKTGVISPGGSAKLAVTLKPGKYTWYCPIPGHKQQGMVGTLTVQ